MKARGVPPGAIVRIIGCNHATLLRWTSESYRLMHNRCATRHSRKHGHKNRRCLICGGRMFSKGKCGDCRAEERHLLRVEIKRLRAEDLTMAEIGEALGMTRCAVEKAIERGRKDGFDFGRRKPGPVPKRAAQKP